MRRRLGAAVVGLGVGEAHAAAYAALDSCDLLWLHDLDTQRAAAAAARYGARVADTFGSILEDPSVDIVSIASYDDAHFTQTAAALGASKHVFVEKPLCRTLDEARELRRLLDAAPHLHLASNLVLRTAPLYGWLRDTIRAGALGRLYALDGDYLYGRLHKITDGWRGDVPDYSVLLGGGVHLLDLMIVLSGERPHRVAGVGSRVATEGTRFRYDDFAAATFTFPSGLIGRVTANFAAVHRHQHVLRVFGTAATFLYDDSGARLHTDRDPSVPPETVARSPLPASKAELISGFVEAAASAGPARQAADHELAVIAACAAADRAIREGGTVDIEYV